MSQVINATVSKAITSADGFHHLVYSISGNTHTLFLDGSAIAVNISGGNVFSSYSTISNLFCGIAGDMSYGYTGYIDDFKVYNRALTTTDVSAIYNSIPVISSPYSSYAITSTAQLLYPLTQNLTNYGVYTSYSSSNVTIVAGTVTYVTHASKIGLNNAYINISGLYATNLFQNGYTISMWFYINNSNGDWNNSPIYVTDNASAGLFNWNPTNAPWNRTIAGVYFSNNAANIGATYSVNNTWQHLVVTVNSSKLCTYYLNAYNWGTTSPGNVLNLNSIQLFNQAYTDTARTLYPTPGRFLSIFNSAFTAAQVTALYNEQLNI